MIEDLLALEWCRRAYHDPTSTKQQVRAAWMCAEAIIAYMMQHKPHRTLVDGVLR